MSTEFMIAMVIVGLVVLYLLTVIFELLKHISISTVLGILVFAAAVVFVLNAFSLSSILVVLLILALLK